MPKTIPFLLIFCLISAIALGQKTDEYRFSLTWSEDSETLDIPVGKMGFEGADWSDELPQWHHNEIIERGIYDADLTNFNPIVEVFENDVFKGHSGLRFLMEITQCFGQRSQVVGVIGLGHRAGIGD